MRNRSRLAGTQYLFMMIVWVVLGLILGVTGLIKRFNYYSSSTLAELEFLIPVVVLLFMDRFEVMRGTRMKMIGIRTILWTLLFTVLILPVTYYLNMVSQLFVPNAVNETVSYFAVTAGQDIWAKPLWLNLLYIAILPPLIEEFIFRGVLFQGFRSCGLFKTAFFTALMFGLAHGNLNQFMYAFAVGIFLAYLVEASGSVYASMLAHSLINGTTVLLMYLERRLPENITSAMVEAESRTASVQDLGLMFWIIGAAIAGACAVLAVIVLRTIAKTAGREVIYQEARKGKDRLKGKEGRVFSVELLVGILIPVVLMAIEMIMRVIR